MLNMFRMLIHPSSGACDLFVELFHGLYCSGYMCVGVTLWFGCGGEVSVCRLRHLFHYLMLNMFLMLIHPSSGACDLFVELRVFHELYCSGSMCAGVTLWLGWCGVVSVCRLRHSHHPIPSCRLAYCANLASLAAQPQGRCNRCGNGHTILAR